MPELLSPAGNFEKMRAALHYGADAVYLAGKGFGMRTAADNFTDEELFEAAEYVHSRGKKFYITVNTMPHWYEYDALRSYINNIKDCRPDAYIVADLGVMNLIRREDPSTEIHISTQASIVSPEAALAYASLGASRLVLARELQLSEIKEIRKALPKEIGIETFIHGSMCVSYSGRCLLSEYMIGRDANRGACAQPCRWKYTLNEEKRPGEQYPVEQTPDGTFIMASKDMCTIEHIPELMESGIDSFKIEGRVKSLYYTAVVTNAYRMAMDAYMKDPAGYRFDPALLAELNSVSHREYCTGFYFDRPQENPQLATMLGYIREKAYFATADEDGSLSVPDGLVAENADGRLFRFLQRNKVSVGDFAEIISPGRIGKGFEIREIYNEKGEPVESAPHPYMNFWTRVPFEVNPGDIMRAGKE